MSIDDSNWTQFWDVQFIFARRSRSFYLFKRFEQKPKEAKANPWLGCFSNFRPCMPMIVLNVNTFIDYILWKIFNFFYYWIEGSVYSAFIEIHCAERDKKAEFQPGAWVGVRWALGLDIDPYKTPTATTPSSNVKKLEIVIDEFAVSIHRNGVKSSVPTVKKNHKNYWSCHCFVYFIEITIFLILI